MKALWPALLCGLWASVVLPGCSRPYRVGDFILVEWGEEKQLYPAYIVAQRDATHFRVHFDGYPARWDEDITLDRVHGAAQGHAIPAPPRHVRIAQGITEKPSEAALLGRFKVGDRLRVRWRESVYRATVLELKGGGRIRVRYEGYEPAWDEDVDVSRVEMGL
jgi:hypothetical protein